MGVEDRGAGITAGDVVVSQEVDRAAIALQGAEEGLRRGKIMVRRVRFLENAGGGRAPVGEDTVAGLQRRDGAVAESKRAVGVGLLEDSA